MTRYQERYNAAVHDVIPSISAEAAQAITGAGAVLVTMYQTNFTSDGAAQALTLADGSSVGQLKRVTHAVDGGSGVLTPVTFVDGTTITFTAVSESWTGIWTAAGWLTISTEGLSALPVIA